MIRMPRISTVYRTIRLVANWTDAVRLRSGWSSQLLTLELRDGTQITCRPGVGDWDVVRELFLRDCYASAFRHLASLSEPAYVLDFGANIGCFSLRAARLNSKLRVEAYEPGSANLALLTRNIHQNVWASGRIRVHAEAVGGTTREAEWRFDAENAGGSSLYGNQGTAERVQVRSFTEILQHVPGSIALVKIDIEGAEYELVEETPPELWSRVPAVVIEIHEDPLGQQAPENLRQRFSALGFTLADADPFGTFFVRPDAQR